jgi:hypothetical protein
MKMVLSPSGRIALTLFGMVTVLALSYWSVRQALAAHYVEIGTLRLSESGAV